MNKTILYVDDFQDNLTVFELVYGSEFEILTATSAAEALTLLRQHEVAVLLADQRMPSMTGTELFMAVKEEFTDTVRYLITAYADLSAAIDAINRGEIRRYLHKPWDQEELGRALREGLEIYQMTRKIRELERRQVEIERSYSMRVCAAGLTQELQPPVSELKTQLDLAMQGLDRAFNSLRVPHAHPDLNGVRRELSGIESYVRKSVGLIARIADVTTDLDQKQRKREESTTADLSEAVRLTVKMVAGDLLKRARLDLQMPEVPHVNGALDQLGQVILNILVSILQRLDHKQRAQNKVRVQLDREGSAVRLSVEDNGPGISEEDQRRLFDPMATPRIPNSSGLGLAISKKIVQDLGGSIELSSEPGQGTRFVLMLPAVDDNA